MKPVSVSNIAKLLVSVIILTSMVISGLAGCATATGFTGLPSLIKLVPADYDQVQYVNIDSLREDKDYYRYYLNFKERLDAITEDMGIRTADVRHFGMAIDERLKVFYLQGAFAADTTGAALEGNGFRKEAYDQYDLWAGERYTVAVCGEMIIFSDLESAVKECIDVIDAPASSLYGIGFDKKVLAVPDDIYTIAATGEEAHYHNAICVCMGLAKLDDTMASVEFRVKCENDTDSADAISQMESTMGNTLFVENFTVEQNGNYGICRFEAPNETLFDFDF